MTKQDKQSSQRFMQLDVMPAVVLLPYDDSPASKADEIITALARLGIDATVTWNVDGVELGMSNCIDWHELIEEES